MGRVGQEAGWWPVFLLLTSGFGFVCVCAMCRIGWSVASVMVCAIRV